MSSTRRKWLLVPLALVAMWLGMRCLGGDDEKSAARSPQAAETVRDTGRMVFRDGKWVRVDGAELRAIMRELASRTPGLIRVSGTVRDTRRRTAVPGAEVVFASTLGESTTSADEEGRYRIEIRPGFYRAFARAEGYVAVGMTQLERLPEDPDATRIGMPRGDLAPLLGVFRDQSGVDMSVRGGGAITGTVYDAHGLPVAGAVVSAHLSGFYQSRIRLVLGTDMDESDLDGSFRLEVPAGQIELRAWHPDFAGLTDASQQTVFLDIGDQKRIDLTLSAGCVITGQVVTARGDPVGEGSLEQGNNMPPPNDFVPVGKLDAQGRFRYASTRPGAVRLRAWPWKSPPTVPRELSCDNGTRYDLTLVVPEADPELEGTVLATDGEPMSHAFVDLFPLEPDGMAQQERADRYGDWAFFALPPGDYHVTAYVPGKGTAAQLVTVPSRGIRLKLSGTGSIAGTVEGMRDGSFQFSIQRCVARTQDGSEARFDETSVPRTVRLVPVENGEFRIDDLPVCSLYASVETPYRNEPVQVDIRPGDSVPLSLDLRQAQPKTVYGVVTDSDRTPLGEVFVSREPGPGTPLDRPVYATTDSDGRYEVQVFTGDSLFFRGAAGIASVEVSWDEGESQRIDVTLEH